MSLETWKEEFYPIDAEYVSEEDAVEHSLRKWIGLRAGNLAKHNLDHHGKRIFDTNGAYIWISESSCALCIHYINEMCDNCPLAALLGHPCDYDDYDIDSPYIAFLNEADPEPTALEQLLNGERNE